MEAIARITKKLGPELNTELNGYLKQIKKEVIKCKLTKVCRLKNMVR